MSIVNILIYSGDRPWKSISCWTHKIKGKYFKFENKFIFKKMEGWKCNFFKKNIDFVILAYAKIYINLINIYK